MGAGPNLISACQPHACCTRSSFTVLHLDAAAGSAKHTTPRYMAPEMHDAYARDLPRAALTHHQGLADIYSVDICTWRLLAGRDVFRRALRHKNQLHVTRDNDQRQILRLYLKSELVSFIGHTLHAPLVAVLPAMTALLPFLYSTVTANADLPLQAGYSAVSSGASVAHLLSWGSPCLGQLPFLA